MGELALQVDEQFVGHTKAERSTRLVLGVYAGTTPVEDEAAAEFEAVLGLAGQAAHDTAFDVRARVGAVSGRLESR